MIIKAKAEPPYEGGLLKFLGTMITNGSLRCVRRGEEFDPNSRLKPFSWKIEPQEDLHVVPRDEIEYGVIQPTRAVAACALRKGYKLIQEEVIFRLAARIHAETTEEERPRLIQGVLDCCPRCGELESVRFEIQPGKKIVLTYIHNDGVNLCFSDMHLILIK